MKENSIEEDIAIAKKMITTKFNNDYSIDNKDKEAIEHILTDYKRVLKENEELENITDKMIDYIMMHQQVKTMRKIFCKHCKLQNSCTYSGIHRNCVRRYFEYISKQGDISKMHEELEKNTRK